jgi:hypothetical protein
MPGYIILDARAVLEHTQLQELDMLVKKHPVVPATTMPPKSYSVKDDDKSG